MDTFVKLFLLISLFCLVMTGVAFVYSNVVTPIESYLRYCKIFSDYRYDWASVVPNEYCIGIAREKIRLHRNNHDSEDEVLLCEETNDSDCFASCLLMIMPQVETASDSILEIGSFPEEDEIAVSISVSEALRLKVGDSVIVKSFLNYDIFRISGVIDNPNGFPEEYDDDKAYVVFFDNNEENWSDYKPFSSYGAYDNNVSENDGKRDIVSFHDRYERIKGVFRIITGLLLLIACLLAKRIIGLNHFIARLRLFGKTKKRQMFFCFLFVLVLFLLLGSSVCLIWRLHDLEIMFCLPVILVTFLLECCICRKGI